MRRILALDIATRTGWALLGGGVISSGVECFARYKGSKSRPAEHDGAVFWKFECWVKERLHNDKPEVVVFEQHGHFKSAAAVGICVGLRGVMMAATAQYGVPVRGYAPRELKKFWCGNGNASKEDMVASTLRRTEVDGLQDDNESDAIALLHLDIERNTKQLSLRENVQSEPRGSRLSNT